MMKIVITGGAGFTGANVAQCHLKRGHDVVIFDNLTRAGTLENLAWLQQVSEHHGRLKVIVGDVRFPPDTLRAEIESADALFHFAAQVAVTTSVTDPRTDFEVNALGTLNVLELVRQSHGKRPVVFFSSTNKVYGGMEDIAVVNNGRRYHYRDLTHGVPEDRGLDFHSPYGCSKGAADQYVRDYSRIYGLRSVVFRQSCIYGYRQFGIEDQGWVAWFIIAALLDKKLTVYGDGMQVRDVLFIGDLIRAYDAAWSHIDSTTGRVYNIGGGPENTVSLLELLDYLGEKLGRRVPVTFADWRPGDQPVYISDIRRAADEMSWAPTMAWRNGVDCLLEWIVANREMLASIL